MAEFNTNLWAPWRMDYIRSLKDELQDDGCFLCRYRDQPQRDAEHHVLWRAPGSYVVMNRFPYTNGHLLVAHARHRAELSELTDEEVSDLGRTVRDALRILGAVLKPDGYNIGYNLGVCAGAGLPDHLHAHVVPRWSGDTNFMAVIDGVRVVPDALDALYNDLIQAARAKGLG